MSNCVSFFKFEMSAAPTRGRLLLAELRSAKNTSYSSAALASLPALIFGSFNDGAGFNARSTTEERSESPSPISVFRGAVISRTVLTRLFLPFSP